MNTLAIFTLMIFSTTGALHSDLERMKSMFEEALLNHPEHTIEIPAGFYYANFETFSLFWRPLQNKYMSLKDYINENEFKEKDYCGYRLWRSLPYNSEVIIGEIISKNDDTTFNKIYKKNCVLGREFTIRADYVFLGDIEEGNIIQVRSPGGKGYFIDPNYYDYPYMKSDTVLVFLRHFPSMERCSGLRQIHKNDIGYRMPFYEARSMFLVSSIYIKEDTLTGDFIKEIGPIHVSFHKKIYPWEERFDYPFSEVKEKLNKFIKWGNEWQKEWYNLVDQRIMNSLILKQFDRKILNTVTNEGE